MLTYNTHLKPLELPEYGRIVQKMVEYALTIENREERTACAYSIINTMKTILQTPDEDLEAERRLWDHLAVISGFKLDIDWPFEIIKSENIHNSPDPIPNCGSGLNNFQYGQNLINMIDATAALPQGPERDAMIILVANQMKKYSLSWDEEGYSDTRIFEDLYRITEGAINVNTDQICLCEYVDAPKAGKKKKKK